MSRFTKHATREATRHATEVHGPAAVPEARGPFILSWFGSEVVGDGEERVFFLGSCRHIDVYLEIYECVKVGFLDLVMDKRENTEGIKCFLCCSIASFQLSGQLVTQKRPVTAALPFSAHESAARFRSNRAQLTSTTHLL
jgi:hypothetical protein